MSVAIKKLDGVESVDVSLEKASADVRFKPGNRITLPQLRALIRKTGYPTRDAEVTARGRFVIRDGAPVLDLLNGSALLVASTPQDAPPGEVEVTGVSRARGKDTDLLTISTIKAGM